MGSFNITRDLFYKPLGDIVKEWAEYISPSIKISDTFGEDIYNIGNLTISMADLGGKAISGYKALKNTKGEGIFFNIKIKNVKVRESSKRINR
ncbi:MAG: hypothetical protein RR523_11870 [Cetobacterium sp.]|uniref:hypothetical protein n=1 Tax=Cetobacterium sp. TaxID=2071632 RepID=UPI002FCBB5AE